MWFRLIQTLSVNVVTKLSEIIDSLGNPGALNAKLVDLANQHKQRGTTRAHFDVSILYKIVGKLLITYPMNCRIWPPCCLDFWLPLSDPPSLRKQNKPGHPPCKASTPSSQLLLEIHSSCIASSCFSHYRSKNLYYRHMSINWNEEKLKIHNSASSFYLVCVER